MTDRNPPTPAAHRPSGEPLRDGRPHPEEPAGWWAHGPAPWQVDPAVLGELLRRHGWLRRGGTPGRYARWTPPGPGAGRTSLLVPESRAFPDSEDLLQEAIEALSRSIAPSAREVLVGLAVPSDEVRWWRDVPAGPAGASLWAAQEQLRTAARQMLTAGGLAVQGRAGWFGARHRRAAAAALEEVYVAGGEGGGRSLTAFVPAESGRGLTVRLHQALLAAREAVDYHRATGGMDAFDAAVEAGVSHELTESLVSLVSGSAGARVAVEWAPSFTVPENCPSALEAVEFSPGDLPSLREAGARYLRQEPSVPVRLTGSVVRLRRAGPRGEGTVRLRVIAGAEVPHVRLTLDEELYRIAGHAHLVGLPVRVTGRLESRGGFRRVTQVTSLAPVQVDEAERDRMLKSLQDNLDFFEEACGED